MGDLATLQASAGCAPQPRLDLTDGADVRARAVRPISPRLLRCALALAATLFEPFGADAHGSRLEPNLSTQSVDGAAEHARYQAGLRWLDAELPAFLGSAGAWARTVSTLCVYFAYFAAPFAVRRPLTAFAALTPAQRQLALERLESGMFAPAFLAAKALLCILYYEAPGALEALGVKARRPLPLLAKAQPS